MTADVTFYKRYYGGGIDMNKAAAAVSTISLEPGGRYWLAAEQVKSKGRANDFLVELGCGPADSLRAIAASIPDPKVVGIDVAFENPTEIDGILFKNHNLNDDWPFEDRSVDHLLAMMVFEHLFDPFHSFAEVARVLAPQGTAYINLPLVTSLKNRLRLALGKIPVTSVPVSRWFDERGWDGNHLHYYSVELIQRLADFSGLKVVEMRGVGPGHAWKSRFPSLLAAELTFSVQLKGA